MGEGNMNLDRVIEQLEYFLNIFGGHVTLGGTLCQQNLDAAPLKCGAFEPASRFG